MIGAEGSTASAYAVEDYRSEVAPELIALWNGAHGARFPLTARLWRQNVDNDPNRAAGDGLLLKDRDGNVQGFRYLWHDGGA